MLGLLPLILLALPLSAPPASREAQIPIPERDDVEKEKPYHVGSRILDEIVLKTLDGREVRLFEDHPKTTIALVFWSLRDPRSHAYRKRLEAYAKEFEARGVKLYLIASSYDEIFSPKGDPLKKFRDFVKKEKFTLPILVDHGNRIADDFGALCANHAHLLDAQRYVRYQGGIDNDPDLKKGEDVAAWLKDATAEVLAGKIPANTNTRPHGRKLKRAPLPPKPAPEGENGKRGGSGGR